MKISTDKTKVLAFEKKNIRGVRIVVSNRRIEKIKF
jgi:hypothetical protein